VAKRLLIVAAAGNFAVALLHFALAFAGEAANRYFGAPPGSSGCCGRNAPSLFCWCWGWRRCSAWPACTTRPGLGGFGAFLC